MKFLDPRNDVAFKKIFGSEAHKGITISFLNSILEYSGDKTIIDDAITREADVLETTCTTKEEGKIKITRNLLSEGMPIKTIARLTGLTEEQIEQIAKNG